MNNYRATSAKFINLHLIRKFKIILFQKGSTMDTFLVDSMLKHFIDCEMLKTIKSDCM